MTAPESPFYPITHDDGLGIIDALADIVDTQNSPSLIAEEFDVTKNYLIGDYVIYSATLYRFVAPHPAGSWNSSHVVQVVVTGELAALQSLVESRTKFYVSGTANAGSSVTFTDARINSEHWRVPKNGIYYGTPSNVTSATHWVTNVTNHTITLEATFSAATTVEIDLEWYQ